MLWNRAISRAQFSPLNFLRPSLPSRVIPSWSLQPLPPSLSSLLFILSSISPPFFFPPLSSAKMPNETHTTSILSQSIFRVPTGLFELQRIQSGTKVVTIVPNYGQTGAYSFFNSHPFDSQFLLNPVPTNSALHSAREKKNFLLQSNIIS